VLHLKLSLNKREGTRRWHRIQLYNCADGMKNPDLHKQTTPTLHHHLKLCPDPQSPNRIQRRILQNNMLHETMTHQLQYTKSWRNFNSKSYYNIQGPKSHKSLYIQGGSSMTGTDYTLFTHKSVPVIFEPPCTYILKFILRSYTFIIYVVSF
jgi:hypothetical protein